jgi:hypothetical protein
MSIPVLYTNIAEGFTKAAGLAGINIPLADIEVQFSPIPHRPPSSLPVGKLAVYVFIYGDKCLKVGKAGANSAPRFCNQHYGIKARSTLAKSLLVHQESIGVNGITESTVKNWICQNTTRVNYLIHSSHGVFALSLLESFVQCCLQPEFEGFSSQRLQKSE